MSKPIDCHSIDINGGRSEKEEKKTDNTITPFFIEALRNGEPSAYRQLVDKLGPQLIDFLVTVLRSKEDAEEITQDIFIHIWQKREHLIYEKFKNIRGYMFTIARTRAIDRINDRKKSRIHYTDRLTPSTDFAHAPDEIVEIRQIEKQIGRLVAGMPRMRRTIYDMRYEQGKTNEEIAKELDLKPSTVRAHISIALREIRDLLGAIVMIL